MGSSSSLYDSFKAKMKKEFDMTDLGLISYFLGMVVHQTYDEIFLYQDNYAREMLNKFVMNECNLVATPITHRELLRSNDGVEKVNKT